MARAFEDQEAVARILESGEDPAIYTSRYPDIPNEPGYLAFLTTIISLGTVGSEFYMTKGHHHRDSAELYIGLSGQGMMIMESHGGGGGTSPSRSWCHRRRSMSPGVGPSRGQYAERAADPSGRLLRRRRP